MRSRLGIGLAALVLTGCLSSTYSIDRAELARLAQIPPEARGARVRVAQRLGRETVPDARRYPPIVRTVAVPPPSWMVQRAARAAEALARASQSSRRERRSRRGDDDDGSGASIDGAAAVAVAAAVLITAGVVVFATVAAIESSRFDGWVSLDPDQPLYLDLRDGSRVAMPLSWLTASDAWSADGGAVSEREGRFERLEDGPLNRVGASCEIDLGAGGTVPEGAWWPAARVAIGGFFLRELGLYGFFGGVFGASEGGALVNLRYGAELQAYPIEAGLFSLGAYASAFGNHRVQDLAGGITEDQAGFGWGAGLAMELAVSTRLSITIRGGPVGIHEALGDSITGEVTVGASVY